MRISDWSSDVCSSDLYDPPVPRPVKVATSVEWVVISCPACGFTYGQRSSQTTQTKRIFRYGPVWEADRKSVVWGKSGSVRVDLGGRRIIQKKNITDTSTYLLKLINLIHKITKN